MLRALMFRGAVVLAVLVVPSIASACGDKFLAPGRGPNIRDLNRPPKEIAVLIYGNPDSPAVSAVSSGEYRKTMALMGYNVTTCTGDDECVRELKGKKFDVVLADARDAKAAKQQTGATVVPVLMKASKEELKEAKRAYGQAYDASSESVKLLPVINHAASHSAAGF